MSDNTTPAETLAIDDPYRERPIFVNQLVGSGHLNGVVNLTFAVALWTPSADGKVNPDFAISSRLRMDLFCAQQIYQALGDIIAKQVKDSGETAN